MLITGTQKYQSFFKKIAKRKTTAGKERACFGLYSLRYDVNCINDEDFLFGHSKHASNNKTRMCTHNAHIKCFEEYYYLYILLSLAFPFLNNNVMNASSAISMIDAFSQAQAVVQHHDGGKTFITNLHLKGVKG